MPTEPDVEPGLPPAGCASPATLRAALDGVAVPVAVAAAGVDVGDAVPAPAVPAAVGVAVRLALAVPVAPAGVVDPAGAGVALALLAAVPAGVAEGDAP